MLTYIIYFIVFIIIATVIVIAIKAVNRGIQAKQNQKESLIKHSSEKKIDTEKNNIN